MGSSKEAKNHCPSMADACLEEEVAESSWNITPCPATTAHVKAREVRILIIKAIYGENMIRFQLPSTSGIRELKNEVVKRLKLRSDTFNMKCQVDEREWILGTSDADFSECPRIFMSSSGNNTAKLWVDPIALN